MFETENNHGFSLVELMVALVIVGILTIGVVMSFTNPIAKVKAVVFEVRGDFNLAKSASVKENEDVLIDFILGAEDGYQICFDTDDDGDCSNEAADDIIKEVTFPREVQFYDFADGTAFPSNGPTATPTGISLDSVVKKDGIVFINPLDALDTANNISFSSNGTSNKYGSVIIYFPADSSTAEGRKTIRGKPYATVINSVSTGRITLSRWRPEKPVGEKWSRK